jgi:hypothetical protein
METTGAALAQKSGAELGNCPVAPKNEGLGLANIISSVGAALGLVAAWLYVAGWAYAYAYFDRFRIPLMMLDIPFDHMLVYGGLVVLKNFSLAALIALLIVGLWSLSRWARRLGRFLVSTILVVAVVGIFALAHAGGLKTADDDFQVERRSDYNAYPRLRLLLKKEVTDSPTEALGDTATTDCGRLLAATKDRLFLIRPSRDALGADIDTYAISTDHLLAMRIVGNYESCR